jgi:hypothetical protein
MYSVNAVLKNKKLRDELKAAQDADSKRLAEFSTSEENFKTDPMNTPIGELFIYNQKINMLYKDLVNYSKSLKTTMDEDNVHGSKNDTYDVRIKSQTFSLKRHELRKLSETLSEATASSMRAYELGLYL